MFDVVRDRELWGSSERHVRSTISSNVQALQRMCLQRKLDGHAGCVNTCSFDTEDGSTLITGSDDTQIMLWDWERGSIRLKFDSGHNNNVFQARMLPHNGGSKLVTCAADGQVRLCELPEGSSSVSVSKSLLATHEGRAHKLALDPLNPQHCFYSSGEDGQVIHYDLRCGGGSRQAGSSSSSRSGARRKLLVCRGYHKTRGPTNRVVGINAIHVNPVRPWQFAVGGGDPWARVYDVRKTRDLPNPSLNPSAAAATVPPTLAAAAAVAAAAGFRGFGSSSSSNAAVIGPPTRQETRESRVYAMSDEPVARLCPEGLWQTRAGGFGSEPTITCVMFSKQGELLASYNDEDINLFSPQASCGELGSSSSSINLRHTAAAAAAAAAEPEQQQQQQQYGSPMRRSREAAAATDQHDQQQDPATATTAAAAVSNVSSEQQQQQHQQQQQQQRYYEQEDEERPRWRRRQRLRSTAAVAAAEEEKGSTAAAAATAADHLAIATTATAATAVAELSTDAMNTTSSEPSRAAADTDKSSTAAAASAAAGGSSSEVAAAAAARAEPPMGAIIDDNNINNIQSQHGNSSSSDRRQQQQQGSAAAAAVGPPACGFGRGFGIPAARFYDPNHSSRDGVVASYYGHRNSATVKGVSFFGENDEYVMSGSDCGHVYIWSKCGGEIVWWQTADEEVVNCVEPHPFMPHVMATSGIDHDVKLWAATSPRAQPPPATPLRAAMAANKRDREAARDAISEPEQWLLQLLSAQRRRARAAALARRTTTPAEDQRQQQQPTLPENEHEHALENDAEMHSAENDDDDEPDELNEDDDVEDVEDEMDDEDETEDPLARLLLPPGVVRIRITRGGGLGRRRRAREDAEAEGSSSDDMQDDVPDDDDDDEDVHGDPERSCYIS